MKYAVHRTPLSSVSNGVSGSNKLAMVDSNSMHSTRSKYNKETTTKASDVEGLKGCCINLPDSFRAVLLISIREDARLAPSKDSVAHCESTAKNNTHSSGISNKELQLLHEVLDPEHDHEHQPPQFQMDQLPAAKTQGILVSGSSSASSPVSIATSSEDVEQVDKFRSESQTSSPSRFRHPDSPPDNVHVADEDFQFHNITRPQSTNCGSLFSETLSPLESTSASSCSGVSISGHQDVDSTGLPTAVALDPFLWEGHQTSNISSQRSCDPDFNFHSCTAPCVDAPSNSTEFNNMPNLEELMLPGTQSLMLNDPSSHGDPITQQVLGDIDIMNNDFNLEVGNSMASDPSGSKSSSMYSCSFLPQTNFLASIIPDSESLQRDPSIMTNELNHEVHDILQQFM